MNHTPVSGNYPLSYGSSTIQNLHGTPLLKKHKCKLCNYQSDRPRNIRRHVEKKHPGIYNKNVHSCGLTDIYKNSGEIPQMGIGQAQVVYQQNIQQHDQTPEHTHVQAACYQPVNVGQNYQQPSMDGRVLQEHAQAVCHQPVNAGGNYQHTMQPQINCSVSQGQIHGQYNGAFQHGSCFQSHIPVNADVETQTEVEMDRDEEGYKRTRNISEILMDISLAYEHMQDLKEEYRDALPEVRKLEEEKIEEEILKQFSVLQVRVKVVEDGLEDDLGGDDESLNSDLDDGESVGSVGDGGESVGSDSDGDKSMDNDSDEGRNSDTSGSENGNSDTEEEETADSEHRKNEDGEVVEEEEDTHEKCSKEHFMDFIFEIKDFLNSKSKKKLARYVAREMKKVKERNGIDDSESDIPQNNDEVIQDVEQISDDFGEIGRECFKTCSKRKIKSIIEIINVLTDDDSWMIVKLFNPIKYTYFRKMLKPYIKWFKKMAKPNASIHQIRKILQKSQVGAKLLETAVELLIPIWQGGKRRVNKKVLRNRVTLLNEGKDKLLNGEFCSDKCINAISECCHNILNDTIEFKPEERSSIKKKLKPFKKDIRRLAKLSTSIQSRRKILQKPQVGNGVLGIIASLVIPALMKLIIK